MVEQGGNAAFLAKTYHPETFRYRKVERPVEGALLTQWVDYFDTNWQKEGLPFNWYTLQNKHHKVGFSMKGQLRTLMDITDAEQINQFRQRTKQDLLGFKLEYLSDHLIYPRKYTLKKKAGRMEDKLYGTVAGDPNTSPDVVEVVHEDERGGTVKEMLEEMKQFFLSDDTLPGSIAIMTSPLGETGLKTDDEEQIVYPDSYFFIMEKDSEGTVMNYTLKTDFSFAECREAILRLTGTELTETADVEDFVKALIKIKRGEHETVHTVQDVITILKGIRPEGAWKDKGWDSVAQDIRDKEKLYEFDIKTKNIIEDFEQFCVPGYATKLSYQKGIAATILRMANEYFDQKTVITPIVLQPRKWQPLLAGRIDMTFGSIMEEVAQLPGCAGGGATKKKTVTTAGGELLGMINNNQEGFRCSECTFKTEAGVSVGDTCPGCGFTKKDYAKKYGVVCD